MGHVAIYLLKKCDQIDKIDYSFHYGTLKHYVYLGTEDTEQ